MQPEESQRITLTEREMCKRLGISRITAWRLRGAGKISYLRIGGRIAYLESHIAQFLKSVETQAQDAQEEGT
jgi:predicted DNA-binding transcriptional regulator AlpA